MALIEVEDLRKSYAGREVVRGVSLRVETGEIVGILGPNGSGKTTTVECIGGLRRRDGGRITVDGLDPATPTPRLRLELGMQLQEARLQPKITVTEAIELYRSFYPQPRSTDELLDRFGLAPSRDVRFEKLSGGQQQRLSVALALVGNPRIAILDELTTGLDPAARREIWEFLKELQDDGLSILLVTHYLEEAEFLCDRVVVLKEGEVVADDRPDRLTSRTRDVQRMTFQPSLPLDPDELAALAEVSEVALQGDRWVVTGTGDLSAVVITYLGARGATAHHLRMEAPSLDDAYLGLVEGTPE
jgi:ABC-2 type transport system ATP-binding protein